MKESTKKLVEIGRGLGRLEEITHLCDSIVQMLDRPDVTKGTIYYYLRSRRNELRQTTPTVGDIIEIEKSEQNTLF